MPTRSTGRLGALTASRTVLRDVGALRVLVGGLMVAPLLVSLLYRAWSSALSLLIAAGFTALAGGRKLQCSGHVTDEWASMNDRYFRTDCARPLPAGPIDRKPQYVFRHG